MKLIIYCTVKTKVDFRATLGERIGGNTVGHRNKDNSTQTCLYITCQINGITCYMDIKYFCVCCLPLKETLMKSTILAKMLHTS